MTKELDGFIQLATELIIEQLHYSKKDLLAISEMEFFTLLKRAQEKQAAQVEALKRQHGNGE